MGRRHVRKVCYVTHYCLLLFLFLLLLFLIVIMPVELHSILLHSILCIFCLCCFVAAAPDLWLQRELSLYKGLTFTQEVHRGHHRHLPERRLQPREGHSICSFELGLQGHAGADRTAAAVCGGSGHPD